MPKKINFDTSLGEFVAEYPQSREVFEKFGLDYCCGGETNIEIATKEKNIDIDELKSLLQKVIDETPEKYKQKKWANESLINIIDHIEKKHHAFTWEKLSSTDKLLDKIIAVHGNEPDNCLINLKNIYSKFKTNLEKHLLIEEDIVFNYAKLLEESFNSKHKKSAKDSRFTEDIIDILNKEHEEAGEILSQMRNLTSNYELPDYACLSFESLYKSLQELEDDLHEHIHLENTILLPRIKKLIEEIDF